MNAEQVLSSAQEQAIAAWINYLNQTRLDRLVEKLRSIEKNQADQLVGQSVNFSNALASIDKAFCDVEKLIKTNRGGFKGVHGYIAEAAQVGIGNARSQIIGGCEIYEWVDDNGQWDLIKSIAENGLKVPIQMKFVQANLSLDALLEHLKNYPDSLDVDGKYQVPKDYYEKILYYLNTPERVAQKLPTSNGEFSLKEWKLVHEFAKSDKIPLNRIEPSDLTYKEVQARKIYDTLSSERDSIESVNKEQNQKINDNADNQKKEAYINSKPSLSEEAKSTAVSAGIEGATTFCTGIIKKIKSGKKLAEFSENDWKEIGGESAIGTLKGGIRGASIYALTNYTATPAAVASALTTASFGIADQVNKFRNGNVTETQLIENSEILCLDAAVSVFSSFVGQVAIPVPVLGAVIGNAVGTMMYQISKDSFNKKEQEILHSYLINIENLKTNLEEKYTVFVSCLNNEFMRFLSLVKNAFAPDFSKAFDGSIELALSFGLEKADILTSKLEIEDYFLN